jgi:hypothetical protein
VQVLVLVLVLVLVKVQVPTSRCQASRHRSPCRSGRPDLS